MVINCWLLENVDTSLSPMMLMLALRMWLYDIGNKIHAIIIGYVSGVVDVESGRLYESQSENFTLKCVRPAANKRQSHLLVRFMHFWKILFCYKMTTQPGSYNIKQYVLFFSKVRHCRCKKENLRICRNLNFVKIWHWELFQL